MNAAKMTPDPRKAKGIFEFKLGELLALSLRGVADSAFDSWHATTLEVFNRYLPDTHYSERFSNISFQESGYLDKRRDPFAVGCEKAQACLESAIEHIERFGLKTRKPKQESLQRGKDSNEKQD
jgi:hypothetical protein